MTDVDGTLVTGTVLIGGVLMGAVVPGGVVMAAPESVELGTLAVATIVPGSPSPVSVGVAVEAGVEELAAIEEPAVAVDVS